MSETTSLIEREHILRILKEETDLFVHLHQHMPIGRESEDVIDNALTQVKRFDRHITYVQISNLYNQMMTSELREA